LKGSSKNCGGGSTPWGTWISCEESYQGVGIWQVDPWTVGSGELTAMGDKNPDQGGRRAGMWESFTFDTSGADGGINRYFFTEDAANGPVRRFTPTSNNLEWDVLNDVNGLHEYLVLEPNAADPTIGTYRWSTNLGEGRASAQANYNYVEGIDCRNKHLYFVSKSMRVLFDLNLETMTYEITSTITSGDIGQPDQIFWLDPSIVERSGSSRVAEVDLHTMFSDNQMDELLQPHNARNLGVNRTERHLQEDGNKPVMYFSEDVDSRVGIMAVDLDRNFFTVLEMINPLDPTDETTGVAFSPDKSRMYFCQQYLGFCYQVWREDGYSFVGDYLNIKYHTRVPVKPSPNLDLLFQLPRQLNAGDQVKSASEQFTLIQNSNGNLVLLKEGELAWETGIAGGGGHNTVFQGDGNVVTRNAGGAVVWKSDKTKSGGVKRLAIDTTYNILVIVHNENGVESILWGAALAELDEPTANPTKSPVTASPTDSPTRSPTKTPTASPTKKPTATPTVAPVTATPTAQPTKNPTAAPSQSPTTNPTKNPTLSPSIVPSTSPSIVANTKGNDQPSSGFLLSASGTMWISIAILATVIFV